MPAPERYYLITWTLGGRIHNAKLRFNRHDFVHSLERVIREELGAFDPLADSIKGFVFYVSGDLSHRIDIPIGCVQFIQQGGGYTDWKLLQEEER